MKKLSDLSCGAFADSFGGVDPAEIARQAAEAREVRGAGEFVDFRGTTVEGDFATFTATLRYEHAPNDPQGLGRPVTVDLQHSDDSWKVFSYKDFGPE
ncbi:hypothetical protein PI247_29205 (plasmid) [Rhodococcus qingshengii]|nr:hypothetical protein [Rhodococcus qingshengii]WCT05907.1 hypothetical protein PI247_29205 [Rhodococcus qingshengii]